MSAVVGIVLGVVTGVAASVIFWYLQFRVFRTKLQISPTIARYTHAQGGIRNQVKIRNSSRRDIVELSVTMRATLPGLVRPHSAAVITLGEWRRPILKRRGEVQYGVRPELMAEAEQARFARYLPLDMATAIAAAEAVDLIEFLGLSEGSLIEVYVFGTDALSGARGFATQMFSAREVCPGEFLPDSFSQTGQFDASAISSS